MENPGSFPCPKPQVLCRATHRKQWLYIAITAVLHKHLHAYGCTPLDAKVKQNYASSFRASVYIYILCEIIIYTIAASADH